MPTSKTIYEAFDGKEFPSEDEAINYEQDVRERGLEIYKKFLGNEYSYERHPLRDYLDPNLLSFIRTYKEEDAWKIMKSLYLAERIVDDNKDYQDDWLGFTTN